MATRYGTSSVSLSLPRRSPVGRKRPRGRAAARRGVILLIIMGLLVMFCLVAIAFVLSASQFKRSSRAISRVDRNLDPPKLLLDQAVRQVIRGPISGPVGSGEAFMPSVMGPHSLLEDMYGNEWYAGTMSNLGNMAGNQLFEFTAPTDNPYRCDGCVLTMTSGLARGQSTRIVGVCSEGKLQAMAFPRGMPANGDTYIINGVPFSGTGFGFNKDTGKLDAKYNNTWEVAFLPNLPLSYYGPGGNPPGGANEDYDACDYQNMLLGAVTDMATGTPPVYTPQVVMPSLHRPDLVDYWIKREYKQKFDDLNADLQHFICLRPNKKDHPIFCAAVNPNFNPASMTGPFDVDCDGDGLPDSIWVDLGMPARAAADGRLYKPLFAILCVDLDGKLNVNAHGSLDQTNAMYYQPPSSAELPPGVGGFAGGGGVFLPRGQGWGPAEINLGTVFGTAGAGAIMQGRYGSAGVAGFANLSQNPLYLNLNFEYKDPSNYQTSFWNLPKPNAFASPPDFLGTGAVGLDQAGHPLFASMGQPTDLANGPYKINLSQGAPRGLSTPMAANVPNNPYSLAELERVLRPYDRDTSLLPLRLANLLNDVNKRHLVTTDSWDAPCPGLAMPKILRDALPDDVKRPRHVTDLLLAKRVPMELWRTLLPPEMLAGMKMDVNRPFGNGLDDNNNGIVDEPAEAGMDQLNLYLKAGSPTQVKFNHLNADDPTTIYGPNPPTDRQLQARYLYVLTLLLADMNYVARQMRGDMDAACRLVAQWAVNVVDFRDRDSIMTKFAYTTDPFTSAGWNPPGDAAHTVWGCERPELLLTESIAWHNRQTEDLAYPPPPETNPTNKKCADGDPNPDQRLRPVDSLFLELYNPNGLKDPPSGEFQPGDPASGYQPGVVVNRKAGPGQDPVWRIVICKPGFSTGSTVTPDDPDDPVNTPPTIERSIYFVPPTKAYGADGLQFYPSLDMASVIAPVLPGRYMVVGPGNTTGAEKNTSYVGEIGAGRPRIELVPSADPATSKVVLAKSGSDATPHNASVAVINTPRRLNVSDPRSGYPVNDSDGAAYDENNGYKKPYDKPFDLDSTRYPDADQSDMMGVLKQTGSNDGFRIAHLQRLADPTSNWDPVNNPYRTVDSVPIDLQVYNGLRSEGSDAENGQKEPGSAGFGSPKAFDFTSRERGTMEARTNNVSFNIWKQEPVRAPGSQSKPASAGSKATPAGDAKFKQPWALSMGYLNEAFGAPNPAGTVPGDPTMPFPWLTWNNRPFSSALELMLVPCVRSSKLLAYGDLSIPPAFGYDIPKQACDPYTSSPWNTNTSSTNRYYPHLLPFLESGPATVFGSVNGSGAQFYRIFDYMHVPSRFVGAQTQVSPSAFAQGDHAFHPPFNKISTYREPGKINLNTIFNKEILAGLCNGFPYAPNIDTFWTKFQSSRQGKVSAPGMPVPSIFSNPFRTFAGGDYVVPIITLRPAREIYATIFRPDPTVAAGQPSTPLFSLTQNAVTDCNNPDRSPFFRYQGIERLGNLATTRSNVYAIWITVGLFEVMPWPGGVDQYHPDGYQLGTELGADTGDIARHRAFYIFDRTIPVGFQRGQDNNIEKGILVRRYLE